MGDPHENAAVAKKIVIPAKNNLPANPVPQWGQNPPLRAATAAGQGEKRSPAPPSLSGGASGSVPLPPRLLPLAVLLLCLPASRAQQLQLEGIRCPGENTLEMRHCAELSWDESEAALRRRLPKALQTQWQQAARAMCAHAYAPFRDGTIHPQLVVGCQDRLNRALLQEFAPINNQGDQERAPGGAGPRQRHHDGQR
jgi:hypothetical protein